MTFIIKRFPSLRKTTRNKEIYKVNRQRRNERLLKLIWTRLFNFDLADAEAVVRKYAADRDAREAVDLS
ncbi:MAG: hypothetical protein AABZ06_11815 [Bdellovibrionota bacterium]